MISINLKFWNIKFDSQFFFDGGKYTNDDKALKQCEKMLKEGADFIDIGAESSKPGSKRITEKEELKRLMPFLEKLQINFPSALFSIDTWKSKIAEESIIVEHPL